MNRFDAVLEHQRAYYDHGREGGLPWETFTPHEVAACALGSWHRMLATKPTVDRREAGPRTRVDDRRDTDRHPARPL